MRELNDAHRCQFEMECFEHCERHAPLKVSDDHACIAEDTSKWMNIDEGFE